MYKNIKLIILIALVVMSIGSLFSQTVAAQPSNYGQPLAGTATNPYLISSLANLRWVSEYGFLWWVDDTTPVYFEQIEDIYAYETSTWNSGAGFIPIGYRGEESTSDPIFIGEYDGNGCTIEGLYVMSSKQYEGLFASIIGNSVIRNLNLLYSSINAYSVGGGISYVGSLVGSVSSTGTLTIENCSVEGSVYGNTSNLSLGGLVGHALGSTTISRSSFKGNVEGYSSGLGAYHQIQIGGIAGYFVGTIERSFVSASIAATAAQSTTAKQIGGIVGLSYENTITNCYTQGEIVTEENTISYVGSITGYAMVGTIISKTYSRMSFNGCDELGGILGHSAYWGVNISDSIWNYYDKLDLNAVGVGDAIVTRTAGRNTPQMMVNAEYLDREWNFTTIWQHDLDYNEGYPFLRDLPTPGLHPRPENVVAVFDPGISGDFEGDGAIYLTWDMPDVDFVNQYYIYKDLEELDLPYQGDFTEYYDGDVYLDHLYRYGIAARYNNFWTNEGEVLSGPTEVFVLTPLYNPPQNLVATPGNTTITLTWDAPDPQNYGVVSYYNVYYDDGTLVASHILGNTYTDTGLTNGLVYEYYVKAYYAFSVDPSANGLSDVSNYDSATPDMNIVSWERPSNYDDPDAGTSGNPYLIANLENLKWLSEKGEDWWVDSSTQVHFLQIADIEATATQGWQTAGIVHGFKPINYQEPGMIAPGPHQFLGVYDGGGYFISHLYIDSDTAYMGYGYPYIFAGLFGVISGNTTLKNINLTYCHISATSPLGYNTQAGGLVGLLLDGETDLTIENCSVDGVVVATGATGYAGGLIGQAMSPLNITNSFTKGWVYGYHQGSGEGVAGGLGGYILDGVIQKSFSSSIIHATGGISTSIPKVGGLFGTAGGAIIQNCYFDGYLSSTHLDAYAGGLIGNRLSWTANISKSYSRGIFDNFNSPGGIIGNSPNNNLTISNCVWNYYNLLDLNAVGTGTANLSSTNGLSTPQMVTTAEYLVREWDFINIWNHNPNINQGYPYLRDLPEPLTFPIPSDLSAEFIPNPINNGSIELNWDEPIFTDNGIVTYYKIYKNGVDLTYQSPYYTTTYTDNDITKDTEYTYGVSAIYLAGVYELESGQNIAKILIPIYNPPRNLIASPGDGFVDLSWYAPLPQNFGIVTSYSIYMLDNSVSTLIADGITTLSYRVTGLTNDTLYEFFVQANYEFENYPDLESESYGSNYASTTPNSTLPYGCERPSNFYDNNAGGVDNPYLIATLPNLRWMSEVPQEWWIDATTKVYFLQTANIDASDTANWESVGSIITQGFRPIGYENAGELNFIGEYDGQNYVINKLHIIETDDYSLYNNIGLFAQIRSGNSVLKNIRLENIDINVFRYAHSFVGGIIGRILPLYANQPPTIIENCYTTGTINVETGSFINSIGGIVGHSTGDNSSTSIIQYCYSNVNIYQVTTDIWSAYAGGIVGYLLEYGNINNTYSRSNITSDGRVGGIVGTFFASFATTILTIEKSYSTGSLSGLTVGGISGQGNPLGFGSILQCFWDTETTGTINVIGGTGGNIIDTYGRSTAEMKLQTNYTDAEWNFTTIWDINPNRNNGYPYLQVLQPPLVNPPSYLAAEYTPAAGSDGVVALHWDPPYPGSNGTFANYMLYKNGINFQGQNNINYTQATDNDITRDTKYLYGVSATYMDGYQNIYESEQSEVEIIIPLYNPPRNLVATPGDGYVDLTWDAPLSQNFGSVLGYNIVRITDQDEVYLTFPYITELSYRLTTMNGDELTLYVNALYDEDEIPSAYSDPSNIVIVTAGTGLPEGCERPSNYDDPDAGTIGNPYLIATLANLRWMSEVPGEWWVDTNTKVYFIQTANIDASDTANWENVGSIITHGFRPIGYELAGELEFLGEYDGQNYVINKLHIIETGNNTLYNNIGLFAQIRRGRSILKNIRLENIDISVFRNEYTYVGGIVGNMGQYSYPASGDQNSIIENCYTTGTISVNSGSYFNKIGGIVGKSYRSSTPGNLIQSCYSNVNIYQASTNTFGSEVGGIVGNIEQYGKIINTYSRANLVAEGRVGGIAGSSITSSLATELTIEKSYFAGSLVGVTAYGISGTGLFAYIIDCFWDLETTGVTLAAPVANNFVVEDTYGRPTSEMKLQTNYTDAGWDFATIWDINPNRNNGYPYLQVLPPPLVNQPNDLTAVYTPAAGSDGVIILGWNPPNPGSIGTFANYRVYKDREEVIFPAPITATEWTDSDITKDTKYIYGVSAVYTDTDQNVYESAPIEVEILLPIYNPPLNLAAIPGDNYVDLSWDAPLQQNYGIVIGYNIYVLEDSEGELIEGGITSLTYRVTDLTNDVLYEFFVVANYEFEDYPDYDGESSATNLVSVTPTGITSEFERPSNYDDPNSGTENNPYLIANLANLRWLSEVAEDWWIDDTTPIYFIQTANINASSTIGWNDGAGFIPIGYRGIGVPLQDPQFIGEYDGQGYNIEGLYINTRGYVGLFAQITGASAIRNVNLTNHYFNASLGGIVYVGGLVGLVTYTGTLTIEDCYLDGYLLGQAQNVYVGGLVGYGIGATNISQSISKGNISGYSTSSSPISDVRIGGIIGSAQDTNIEKCYSSVSIGANSDSSDLPKYVGGISGWMTSSSIGNSYAQGIIEMSGDPGCYAGGIAGYAQGSNNIISKTYSRMEFYTVSVMGGIVGRSNAFNLNISDSVWNFYDKLDLNAVGTGSATLTRTNGLFTIDMTQTAEYLTRDWDFTTIWNHDLNRNQGYPYLRNLPEPPLYPAPENLTAEFEPGTITPGTITLEWDVPSQTPDGALVYFKIYKNGEELVFPAPWAENMFIDMEINLDEEYEYGVSAVYTAGQYEYESGQAIIKILAPLYNPPQNLMATPGYEIVDLVWQAPIPQNYGIVTGYNVYTQDGNDSILIISDITETSYRVTDLTNDETYEFFVLAYYEFEDYPEYDGESWGTDWVSATPFSNLPYGCERPTNFDDPDAGTSTNPYLIANLPNLKWMSEVPLEWWIDDTTPIYFIQTADIDAMDTMTWNNGAGFIPIGYRGSSPIAASLPQFIGDYNGQGYTINNLRIQSFEQNVGLFARITGDSYITDVHLIDHNISVMRYNEGGYVGAIVGEVISNATLTMESCSTIGSVSVTAGHIEVGGLIGRGAGTTNINLSYTKGGVYAYIAQIEYPPLVYIGGLIGMQAYGEITRSFSSANVFASASTNDDSINLGGIVGRTVYTTTISDCYFDGNLEIPTGYAGFAGGLIGLKNATTNINRSYFRGQFEGFVDIAKYGAIVGKSYTATLYINDSVWNSDHYPDINAVGEGFANLSRTNGLPTISMTQTAEYLDRDWDFTTIWSHNPDKNQGYPYLMDLPEPVSFLAPQNLTAEFSLSSMTTGTITLEWDPPSLSSEGIFSYYQIYKNGEHIVFPAPFTAVTYSDYEISLDEIYLYGVSAVYLAGDYYYESGQTTIEILAPRYNPPMRLLASPGDELIDLNWLAPVPQNYGIVTGYSIYSVDEGMYTLQIATDIQELTYRVTGLTNDETYEFFVQAIYEFEDYPEYNTESNGSNWASATPNNNLPYGCERPSNYHDPDAGTSVNPYLITTLSNLRWMSEVSDEWWIDNDTPIYFNQTTDIDATDTINWSTQMGIGFQPINHITITRDETTYEFVGVYDGQDYTISNLYINIERENPIYIGLFGNITGNSTIMNVHLVDANYNGAITSDNFSNETHIYAGGIAARSSITATLTIENCSFEGVITTNNGQHTSFNAGYVGGLIGASYAQLNVSNAYSKGSLFAYGEFITRAGGIVGDVGIGYINKSYSSAYVLAATHVGGIAGIFGSGVIENCYSNGHLESPQTAYIGGIAGEIGNGTGSILKTYSTSILEGGLYTGGIAGNSLNELFNISNSVWNSDSSGNFPALGFGEANIFQTMALPKSLMRNIEIYTVRTWDFDDIWSIDPNRNSGYPYLQGMPEPPLVNQPASIMATHIPSAINAGCVTLNWTAPSPGSFGTFAHYIVYRDGEEIEVLSPISATEATDVNIILDTKYVYGVSVVYMDVNQNLYESTPKEVEIIIPMYNPPQNLVATPGDGFVTLNWEAPLTQSFGTVLGYNVIRLYEGDHIYLTSPAITELSYTLALPNGYEITLYVNAIYGGDIPVKESLPSNIITTAPGIYLPEGCERPSNYNDIDAGTENNPYIIANLANLRWMSEVSHEWWIDSLTLVYFIQIADIDAAETENWHSGAGFKPIGHPISPSTYPRFKGSYDGNGHTISNIHINAESDSNITSYIGFFTYLSTQSTIMNLSLENINYNVIGSYTTSIGGIVGEAYLATITNCHTSGTIAFTFSGTTYYDWIGGISGSTTESSSINYSSSKVNILPTFVGADSFCGGISGMIADSQIYMCYFTGNIGSAASVSPGNAGGLVGRILSGASWIGDSYAKGNIHNMTYAGGIAGQAPVNGNFTIIRTYAAGNLLNNTTTGGFIGYLSTGEQQCTVQDSFWDIWATGISTAVGYNHPLFPLTLTNSEGWTTPRMTNWGENQYLAYGWDFDDIWEITPFKNQGYPFFQNSTHLELLAPNPDSFTSEAGQITINWLAPIDVGLTLQGYKLYRDGVLLTETTELTHTDTDVEYDNIYFYSYSAVYNEGESYKNNTIVVYYDYPPLNLTATNDVEQVVLDWEPPVPENPGNFSTYYVYRDNVEIANTTETTYTDTDVIDNTEYSYYVSASYLIHNIHSYGYLYTTPNSNTITITPGINLPEGCERPSNYDDIDAGTENNPYIIANLANLRWMSEVPTDWYIDGYTHIHFIQTSNIDATPTIDWNDSAGFIPIGIRSLPDQPSFRGVYDGDGYVISNLYMNRQNERRVGLFGGVGSSLNRSFIKNLGLENILITLTNDDLDPYGYVFLGGLLGRGENTTITNCFTTGIINYSSTGRPYIGGIIGESINCIVENSYSTTQLNTNSTNDYIYTGGIVGEIWEGTLINNCYFSGSIFSYSPINTDLAGGITGYIVHATISNSYSLGHIVASRNAGGLVGLTQESSITHSYAAGEVTSGMYNGGLVGEITMSSNITSSFWDIWTTGVENAVGNGTGNITDSYGWTTPRMTNWEENQYLAYGWDFEDIWEINPNKNQGYPFFQNSTHPQLPVPNEVPYVYETGQITINWTAPVLPVLGYRLYRDGILLIETTQLTYTDTDVEINNTYFYSYSALYEIGESYKNNRPIFYYDYPPQNLTATIGISGQVLLNWDPPLEGNPGVLQHYFVYRDSDQIAQLSFTQGTTYTDIGVINGTEYSYFVQARFFSPDVYSTQYAYNTTSSNIVTATPAEFILPPQNVIVTLQDNDAIITWTHPQYTDPTPISSLQEDEITQTRETSQVRNDLKKGRNSRDLRGFWVCRNSERLNEEPVYSLIYIDEDVPADAIYTYGVIAVYNDGESEEEQMEDEEILVPGYTPPSQINAVIEGFNVTISWQAPEPQNYGTLSQYVLSRTDQLAQTTSWELDTNTMSYIDNGLLNHMVYVYNIKAYYTYEDQELNGASIPVETEEIWFGANDMVSPQNLSVESSNGNLLFTWTHSNLEFVIGYNFYYYETQDIHVLLNNDLIPSNSPQWSIIIPADGLYTYAVTAVYRSLHESESNNISIEIIEGNVVSEDDISLPITETILKGNYPNPFNPSTIIHFSLNTESNLRIDIYNIKGQKVTTLIDGNMKPGNYQVEWNGTDDNNRSVSSGIYFYRMTTSYYTAIKRMTLMK